MTGAHHHIKMRKVESCSCGYRSRKDNVDTHKRKCIARAIIENLEHKSRKMEEDNKRLTEENMQYKLVQVGQPIQHCDYVDLKTELNKMREKLEEAHAKLDEAHSKLEEKNQEIQQLMKKPQTVINNNNNVNNVNIIIPFGHEKMLDRSRVLPLLRRPSESVPKYIQMKHFNAEGVGNVRIPNVRGNMIEVMEEDANGWRKWVKKNKQQIICDLTSLNLDELVDKFGAESIAVWKMWYDNTGLSKDGYDKTREWKELVKKVELVLLNNRD